MSNTFESRNRGTGGGLSPIPANTALGNFTGAVALPTPQTKSAWLSWLNVPTNDDSRLSNAREWIASTITQTEAEAGTATTRRAFTAQRVRQAIVGWWTEEGFGDRLGVVYDIPNAHVALECADSEWNFFDATTRDNLRIALNAAAATHSHNASAINAGTLDDARLSANIPRMVGGVIQASNLPSYVDDVLEFANLAAFPVTGETGKIYVALNTNLTYRWSGSAYVEISPSSAVWGNISGTLSNQTDLQTALNAKQNTLVSGTSIRTVNGNSLLGSGDVVISGLSAIASQTILGNNTGGSAVPTGLTQAQVRTLLGLATTDSPTFAGVTLGNSGVLVGGTNLIEQRNGTNAQTFDLFKTFISSTNNERLTFDAASDASNYRIGSRIGSAGGTTRGLQLGSYNAAGTWTSWLGIDTSGNTTVNQLIVGGSGSASAPLIFLNGAGTGNAIGLYRSSFDCIVATQGVPVLRVSFTAGLTIVRDNFFGVSSAQFDAVGAVDTRWSRSSAGVWRAGTTANNALGSVELLNLVAGGDVTLTPSSSRTLSTNGQFTFETPSNTEGNLVYRGSDGTTRRFRFPIGVYSLPLTDGTNGQVLKTNGAGVVTWQNDNTGGGGGGGVSEEDVIAYAVAL